ncbi:HlyD family secretion protein [Novipirellula galeiformis]|uniref:HlyD family secretion protein n=1 Tax=Novipirellula galeiformis TaxID=2528004 RepID=A0A5C6CBE2_9BACT|nr:HlyD family efflux transporter periplasmic adaptor subunit [Novipirellula galeiformis]TWU21157.1 HlyD family secretion protein [Novipirellula galeiformis]
MSKSSTPSSNAIAVRVRADLVAVQTRHQNESAYVVKDPVAMTYHRLRPDEYFILDRLDGTRSLDQLCHDYEHTFHPQKVSKSELNQLLFRFHQSGLTISDATNQGDRLCERRHKELRQKWMQQCSSLLFIRFPGVDPEPFLRRVYPWVGWLLSPWAIVVAGFICIAAACMMLVRLPLFAAEFPTIGVWLRFESILILAAVIGGTKVLHELGHALVCKHFGGECHQIGPMLLVFTPALYCDTSDSWLLPNRFHRAAVGLAGIGSEVMLAAIATWVWTLTAEGLVHSIAMNVMLVCGVSTIVFNANPLLRYDGYYVLADLCDVPNLAERSRRLLSDALNRWLLGVDAVPDRSLAPATRFWMIAYAITAAVYRWSLTLLILWFVSLMLRPYGLESIGRLLAALAILGMLYSLLQRPLRFFRNPARRTQVRVGRLFVSVGGLVLIGGLALWPMPSSISTTARITPRKQTSIYISTSGMLESLKAHPGDTVSTGDAIAVLVNHEVEADYVQALGRVQAQTGLIASLRQSRYESPEAANELPAAEALLSDLEEQLKTRRERRDALVIRATASGRLIVGARTPDATGQGNQDAFQLVSGSGYPTDAENANGYLRSGTELMSIVESEDWDVEVVMSQTEVQRIAIGASVKLALESDTTKVFWGKVSEISRAEWTAEMNTPRWDDANASRQQAPAATSYVVRAAIEHPEGLNLIAGGGAISRIEAAPLSFVARIFRGLNSLLRFR